MQTRETQQAPGSSGDGAFGEFLIAQGILGAERLRQCLDAQHAMGGRLDTVILDLGFVSESVLLQALGEFHSTRTVSAAELTHIPADVARTVSPRMAERLETVPFRLDGRTLLVATVRPGDLLIEDELSLLTDCTISSCVTLEVRLYETMNRLYAVEPSIQISSVLNRLHDQARPTAGVGNAVQSTPSHEEDLADVPAEAQSANAIEYFGSVEPAPSEVEDAIALEISQEDLEQFPSLRGSAATGRSTRPDLHARPPDSARPAGHEDRLRVASIALQNAEMREDIADALLEYCAPILRRRLMLAVRDDTVIGWRGEGEGINPATVRGISIPLSEPSVFVGLVQGAEFWLGPLPNMPRNHDLVRGLGGGGPSECIILPLIVRSKTVCFLYGDNMDQSISGIPISQLRRLVAKASLAFQVYLFKSKIRNL